MVGLLLIPLFLGLLYLLFLAPSSKSFSRDKVVALTFDDGPNNGDTSRLLDILNKHGVSATFFLVGNNAQKYPKIVKRIQSEGHVIGLHSMRHAFRDYFLPGYFKRQMLPAQQLVANITNQNVGLVRMPWLFRAPWLAKQAKRLGFTIVRGAFGSNWEVFQPSADKMAEAALKKAKPGLIYIFHDGYNAKGGNRSSTVESIDILIPELKKLGYGFTAVDELLD